MRKVCLLAALVVMLGLLPLAANATNVALNAAVTLNGTFFTDAGSWGSGVISPGSTIVNGSPPPDGTQWNLAGVWWNGYDYPSNNIVINLGGAYSITSFVIQADDNDLYHISYWTGSAWQTAWDVPSPGGWGLTTSQYTLAAPIVTDQLMVTATPGDGYYSVSQVVANGSPVPVPASMLLLAPGLVGVAGIRRRFKKQV
jgi:hypothetical protein